MKSIFTSILSLIFIISALSLDAQTTYEIKKSETWANNSSIPNPCFNCTFNIADGVVITVTKNMTLSDVTVNGGKVIIEKDLMLWSNGGKNTFNNVEMIFNGKGQFTGNGGIVTNNADFTFNGTTNMLSNTFLEMTGTRMQFNENSYFVGQGSKVALTNSQMVAGDGLTSSKAYIKMNGAQLILTDTKSGVQAANVNNYYFNWNNYTSTATGASYKTTDNKSNCGTPGTNACSMPVVYGPIALTPTGVGSYLVLPVIISDFTAAVNASGVNLNWSTQQESNSAYFLIERSVDGSNWMLVARVNAAGNSAVTVKYSYNDAAKVSGAAHYRLKMVDQDNSFAYSATKSVRSSLIASMKVYPNPSVDFVNVSLDAKAGNSVVKIFSQAGQLMTVKNVKANSGVVSIPVQQYQNGNYVINVTDSNGANQSVKLLVQHSR